MKNKNYIKSIITMSLSAVGFAVVQSIVKFLGPSVSSWTKAFYRSFFGFIFLLLWLLIIKMKPVFNNKFLLLVRGLAGAMGLVFSFWAIDLVDLSHATIYLYSFPVYATIFSSLIYRNPFKLWYILPLMLSFTGVIIIASPGNYTFTFGDIIGISSGIVSGIAVSTIRELHKTDKAENIYFSFTFISIIFCAIGIGLKEDQTWTINELRNIPVYAVFILLIFTGLIATVSQLFMTWSYKHLDVHTGSILQLLTMPIVTFIAIVIFKEPFKMNTIWGGIMIFAAAAIVSFPSKNNKNAEEVPVVYKE